MQEKSVASSKHHIHCIQAIKGTVISEYKCFQTPLFQGQSFCKIFKEVLTAGSHWCKITKLIIFKMSQLEQR